MRIRSVALRTNNITGNIKLRMKTILRNLLSVLCRFKMATLLNVLGLSVAFSAFILIMMQVDYDRNFDRGIKDVDRIFRVEVAYESGTKQAIINRPLAEAFTDHHRIFWPVVIGSLGRGRFLLYGGERCSE